MSKKPPKGPKGPAKGDEGLDAARAACAEFLAANPHSALERVDDGPTAGLHIMRPWGDPSLSFRLPEDYADTAACLNDLILPHRLSAIYHRAARCLEMVWTARKLGPAWTEVDERKFTYKAGQHEHTCEFTKASDSLVNLSGLVVPQTQSPTAFRNMQSISAYYGTINLNRPNPSIDKPRSFWVSNIDWDDIVTIEFLEQLNFYLAYYDDRSPVILIHEFGDEKSELIRRTRYIRGSFPKNIQAKSLDRNLVSFFSAAQSGNRFLGFILYYRIIEYAAFHFVDSSFRAKLKKILSAPDLNDNVSESIDEIVGSFNSTKLEEIQRFRALVRENVSAKVIWRDVQASIATLSKETKFDGGFSIAPLVGASDKEAEFCAKGLDTFSDSIRKIRNTLSHGKDQESGRLILPTARNSELLRPWVHLIATAAGEIVLYKDAS